MLVLMTSTRSIYIDVKLRKVCICWCCWAQPDLYVLVLLSSTRSMYWRCWAQQGLYVLMLSSTRSACVGGVELNLICICWCCWLQQGLYILILSSERSICVGVAELKKVCMYWCYWAQQDLYVLVLLSLHVLMLSLTPEQGIDVLLSLFVLLPPPPLLLLLSSTRAVCVGVVQLNKVCMCWCWAQQGLHMMVLLSSRRPVCVGVIGLEVCISTYRPPKDTPQDMVKQMPQNIWMILHSHCSLSHHAIQDMNDSTSAVRWLCTLC
jgi:hypothetical protein